MAVPTVDAITIKGFKSLYDETRIELRPLTILAGANSSGKSSAIQPLLLLKQTLESAADYGPLRLNGPDASFTKSEQFLSRDADPSRSEFFAGFEGRDWDGQRFLYRLTYVRQEPGQGDPLAVQLDYRVKGLGDDVTIRSGMGSQELRSVLERLDRYRTVSQVWEPALGRLEWVVARDRCFIGPKAQFGPGGTPRELDIIPEAGIVRDFLSGLIHLPGLRGNAERQYESTAFEKNRFPGQFQDYVASVILRWHTGCRQLKDKAARSDAERKVLAHCKRNTEELDRSMRHLQTTHCVRAVALNDAQIELQVGRLTSGGQRDRVNIADVGVGVSQVLPVVVALLVGVRGQAVYIEQPEIHLHPRAQLALAKLLADAANRGVRVIAETHSDLLLLGVQTLVAEGKLDPGLVALHWFERNDDGITKVKSAELDGQGAFGAELGLDFREVLMSAQKSYLDAGW